MNFFKFLKKIIIINRNFQNLNTKSNHYKISSSLSLFIHYIFFNRAKIISFSYPLWSAYLATSKIVLLLICSYPILFNICFIFISIAIILCICCSICYLIISNPLICSMFCFDLLSSYSIIIDCNVNFLYLASII